MTVFPDILGLSTQSQKMMISEYDTESDKLIRSLTRSRSPVPGHTHIDLSVA